ncbi:Transposase-associated domain [Sesbania bispinosa]|nr:Transposase-associated domain [Sesbania bispinosa]
MDKQKKRWMKLKYRSLPEYLKGIDDFLDFAFSGPKPKNTIRCSCCKCNNFYYKTRDNVMHDLLKWGFEPSYKHWEYHGESSGDSLSDNDSNFKDEDDDFGVNS